MPPAPGMTRRATLGGLAALALAGRLSADEAAMADDLARIEAETGGRLGLFCHDTGSGRLTAFRADERFPMMSTFKLLVAGAVLARIDAGAETADRQVPILASDLTGHCPVTRAHVGGALSVKALCAAAVQFSDNAAANLLLAGLDGPEGLTAWLRGIGDPVTRLDRIEPDLNEGTPGDPRDTTTPAAMAATMDRLLIGPVLAPTSRHRLTVWMEASDTGLARLRAGLPGGWRAGDKTGTGGHGSVNDVAILWPPGRAPWLVCLFMTQTTLPRPEVEAAQAAIARRLTGA